VITELNYTLPSHWLQGRRLCIRTMKRTALYRFHQPMRSGHTIPTQTVEDLKLSSIRGMTYCSPARKKYRPRCPSGVIWTILTIVFSSSPSRQQSHNQSSNQEIAIRVIVNDTKVQIYICELTWRSVIVLSYWSTFLLSMVQDIVALVTT
jgi:hypothetical protein